MGYITVKFLGDEYQISDSINDFLEYDKLLTQITKKLMDAEMASVKSYAKYKPSRFLSLAENESGKYRRLTEEIANSLVKKLIDQNIYDVTKEDILKNTNIFSLDPKYVGEYDKFVLQTQLEAKIKELDYLEQQQIGMANAYMNAANSITGSGLTVFSSSFATLMAHSIVEQNILSSQAKKADKEYQAAIKQISARADNAYEEYCRNTMFNTYFPKLTDMLTDFADSVMAEFLSQLTLHGKYDFESMKQYNLQKAENMLKNINQVQDKKDFLKQVFIICPFCINVYIKCMELGLMDNDTIQTAEHFGFKDVLYNTLENHCKTHINQPDVIKEQVLMLAQYKGVSETEIYRSLYKDILDNIIRQYQALTSAVKDNHTLDKWIRKNIVSNTETLISTDPDRIKDKLHKAIWRIISQSDYDKYAKLGILTASDIYITDNSAMKLSHINSEIESMLWSQISDYINEAKLRKQAYNQALNKYHLTVDQKEEAIFSKETELNSMSLFAFSQKKELKKVIADMKNDLQKYKVDGFPEKLEQALKKCIVKIVQVMI